MDVEVDVRKPQPPCPFSRSLPRGRAGRGAQAAGTPGRLGAATRAAVARDGAGRGRPAGDGSEAGRADGARSPTPPVRGAAAAVGVARRGPRPLPNVAPRRPVRRRRRRPPPPPAPPPPPPPLPRPPPGRRPPPPGRAPPPAPGPGAGRPAAGEAFSGRGEWKAGWRLARFVWPGALLTFSAVGLDFSVHFHSTGAEEAGPGAGRGCCARMEICKDEEEVRACIREGRKFHLDPSVTELELRSVSRWSSLLILCSSSHRVHLGMVFDIFSERHRCGLGPAHRRCAGEQLVADAVEPPLCASLSLHSRSHWRRCSSHPLLF